MCIRDSSKATLNLPVYEDEFIAKFPPPGYLVLTDYVDNEDLAIQGITGGTYNEMTNNYTFTITTHIQKIISENKNPKMRLYVGGKNTNAERLLVDNRVGSSLTLDLVIIK